MSEPYSEEIKIRVPARVKKAFAKLATRQIKKEAEIAREAFADYLKKPEIECILREESVEYKTSGSAPVNSGNPPERPLEKYVRSVRRRQNRKTHPPK